MPLFRWVGKASRTAEKDEAVFTGTWANAETVTFQLRDEGNGLHSVVTALSTPTSPDNAADQVLAQLNASGDAEFLQVTWAKGGTDKIHGTAKTAGVPFHLTISETSTSGSITHNKGGAGGSIATSGPNDVATVANYQDSAGSPAAALWTTNDDLLIAEGSDPLLYSLRQNELRSLGAGLSTLRKSPNHRGAVGDPDRGYKLAVDVNGSGEKVVEINSRNGGQFLWTGRCPTVLARGSISGPRSIELGGDVDALRLLGSFVRGEVRLADTMTLDDLYALGCPHVVISVGKTIASFDLIEQDAGSIDSQTNPLVFNLSGTGYLRLRGIENFNSPTIRGGTLLYEGEGDQAAGQKWTQHGGLTDLRPRSTIQLRAVEVNGGLFTDKHAAKKVAYESVKNYGGDAQVTGVTVATD
jgi:hypothetical protein